MGDASTPPAIFNNVFNEYNFVIISNLFDNNKGEFTRSDPLHGGGLCLFFIMSCSLSVLC